jgi:hypothetical protein
MVIPVNRSKIPPLGLFGSPVRMKLSLPWSGLPAAIRLRISSVAIVELCEHAQTWMLPGVDVIAALRSCTPTATDWSKVMLPMNGHICSGVDTWVTLVSSP